MTWTPRLRLLGSALCVVLMLGCAWAARAVAELYWSSPGTKSIFRANFGGSGPLTSFSGEAFGTPSFGGIAVGAGHIFWTWGGGIGRANLDGSEPDKSFIGGEGITDVAVGGEYLYWSGGGGKIGRAIVNGSKVEPNFITGIPGGA